MKPIILTIDDDPGALIAVKRDLERQYEKRFRIVGSDSGELWNYRKIKGTK